MKSRRLFPSAPGGCRECTKIHIFASEKDGEVCINLVNADMKKEKEILLTFPEPVEYVSGKVLESGDPHDCNTKQDPDKIRVKESAQPKKTDQGFTAAMKPASIQVLRFTVQR